MKNVCEYLNRKGFDPKYPNAGNPKCSKCGVQMEHKVMYNFGDPNLGVQHDWYQCPHCNHRRSRC